MEKIALKEQYLVNGRLAIVLTNKAFDNLYAIFNQNYSSYLSQLSACTTLLIDRKKTDGQSSTSYIIHFNGCCLNCAENRDKNTNRLMGLCITFAKKEDFYSQNTALSKGIIFSLPQGSCVTVKNSNYKLYEEYVNGTRFADTNQSNHDYSSAVASIIKQFNCLDNKSEATGTETIKEYEPSDGLEEKLDLAETYSDIESMLAESVVRADEGLTYTEIKSIDYDRTDRIAYRFIVTSLKKDVYAVGTQVELQDVFGNPVNAEIIESEMTDDGVRHIDLLFNKQVNIQSIEPFGTIRLSYSSVIKDVQQRAIERIRKNEAPAKYMDDILGTHTPKGFHNTNLSHLETFYIDKDKTNYDYKDNFPPNPSQREAILNGIKSKDVFLVMGPPGTGKTTVILEWIKYFVLEKHMRVLVSSQNNKAVDNVLERIIKEEGIDVLRIGSEAKLQENVKECMYENKINALRENISDSAKNNSELLNSLTILWENNILTLRNLSALLKEFEQRKAALENEVNGTIFPLYSTLSSLIDEIHTIQNKITELYNKFESHAAIEQKRNNCSNPVMKFIYSIIFFILSFSLKSKAKKILDLKGKEKDLLIAYRQEREKYESAFNKLHNGAFSIYSQKKEEISLRCEELLTSTETTVTPTLPGMFNFKINEAILTNQTELASLEKNIKLEIQRAKATTDVILTWSNDMKSEQTYSLEKLVLQNVNLVGATCIGISSQKRFAELDFDVTIIDEAGQIQIHNALVPMSLSNKLIMLGDHKQIPPSADEKMLNACRSREIDPSLLEKSLFEDLYNKLPDTNKRMLDTQFRMPGEIADIISEWFYNGEYKSPPFKRNLPSLLPDISEKPFIVIDTADNKRRFEQNATSGGQTIHYNDLECEIITDIIKYLAKNNFDLSNIGVIAGLKAQVKRIKEHLLQAGFDKTLVNEMVATLDSFQGQERKIILYSFTRSSNKQSEMNRVGFLTELRRINVAMSRCKQTMVMIGNMTFLANCKSIVNYRGEQVEYEKTEKNFSEFINKMINDIKDKDRGEIINTAEFKRRLQAANKETET